MGTKVKGLLKGLRYISQIFDEEKDSDMQIGFPTDVKHVAHIGWDGPAAPVESPSWMKEFSATSQGFSAPLNINGVPPKENPEIKWVSEDTKKGNRAKNSEGGKDKDTPEVPKSSRRRSSTDGTLTADSPTKDSSTRSKHRKSKDKDSSDASKSSRHNREPSSGGSGIESGALPDIPKKSRRKKSKEESVGGGSSRSSRSKAGAPTNGGTDHGHHDSGEFSQDLSLKPPVEEKEN